MTEERKKGKELGTIHPDAQVNFFDTHKDNEELMKLFLTNFDIKAAHEKYVSNTVVYAYILQPHEYMIDPFGLEKDILLVYSPFDKIEPRSIQAVDELYRQYPYRGRVDTLNCFLLSDASDVETWVNENAITENIRNIIPFSKQEVVDNKNDDWYLRNKLRKYFFDYDLFNSTLPLKDDKYFFGRQQIAGRYISAIKRGQNRGIFGLRKTGKTSLLFKIQRIIAEQNLGEAFYYDCKKPSYRNLHWTEFLYEIYSNICERLGMNPKPDREDPELSRNFTTIIKEAAKKGIRIVLIFDEIEYISFVSPLPQNAHWKTEFIDFWQTIWSVQSARAQSNLSFIVSGVNASIVEDVITIDGKKIPNPLLAILQFEYITGLDYDDCNKMIRQIGKRMGLHFDYESVKVIFDQYGGHPMLTRLACSQIHMSFSDVNRPIPIGKRQVEQMLPTINSNLVSYFNDVVYELQEFYPNEYTMFEMLASGQIADFMDYAQYSEFTKHLYNYGLIEKSGSGIPRVKMPVAAEYIAWNLAKKEHRTASYKLVANQERSVWVKTRIQTIVQELRQLEIIIAQNQQPKLYGKQSIPEADKLIEIPVADSDHSFVAFINTMHKCLVESIENYGWSIRKQDYFWTDIKTAYPELFDALYRTKVYRNKEDHLPDKLKASIRRDYVLFKTEDTAGFSALPDQLYAIQQKLLDKYIVCIHLEMNKLI